MRLFYGLYFSIMGLMLPFFPLYLDARGYDAMQIAWMVGTLSLARILAPPLFGHLLDNRGRSAGGVMLLLSLLAAVAMSLLHWEEGGFALSLLLLGMFAVVWAGMLIPADAVVVRLRHSHGAYGRVRLWGSLGFIVASLLAARLLAGHWVYLPWLVALLMLALGVCAMGVVRAWRAPRRDARSPSLRHAASLRRLLWAAMLMQCSHGAYYTFYSLRLESLGLSSQIGMLWTVAVLAEVVLFWGLQRLSLPRASAALRWCFLWTALRWLGIAYGDSLPGLLFWQLLHAMSFAAFHVFSVMLAARLAPPGQAARVQGLLAAAGFGAGGALGALMAGWMVEHASIPDAFLLCSALALLGCLLYPVRRARAPWV